MRNIALFFLLLSPLPLQPIVISQVMLGRAGNAKHEFVELYNPNETEVNLAGYSLSKKTASGQESLLVSAKKFIGQIKAKSYFLIASPELATAVKADLSYSNSNTLAKNNSLILYDQEKTISDQINFSDQNDPAQQSLKSPDKDQAVKRSLSDSVQNFSFILETENIKPRNSKNENIVLENQNKTSGDEKNNYQIVDLKTARKSKAGDLIVSEGLVSSAAGVLGSQFFYIHQQHPDGNIYGLKVYNYYKLFPELKRGDRIKVRGEIVISSGEILNLKLKTKEASDIEIIASDEPWPETYNEAIISFQAEQNDHWKTVRGQITQNSQGKIYLDDGQDEILVEIKTGSGISKKQLMVGQNFSISGILNFTSPTSSKIIPVQAEDVKSLETEAVSSIAEAGENLNDAFWSEKKKERRKTILSYGLILSATAFIFIILRKKKEK